MAKKGKLLFRFLLKQRVTIQQTQNKNDHTVIQAMNAECKLR